MAGGLESPLAAPAPLSRWRLLIVCLAAALVALVGIVRFWDGGVLDTETISFVGQYTGERSWLVRVFDPHANDFGTYQARELSYLCDLLDARFYVEVIARWWPDFLIPASACLVGGLFAGVFWWGVRRTATRLDDMTAGLIFAGFVSCFGYWSSLGLFYRSGKLFVAVAVLALLFGLRRARRAPDAPWGRGQRRRALAGLFGLALVAGLLDRQGFFYVLAATGVMFLHYRCTREGGDIVIALGLAAAVLQLYNVLLGPMTILALNGYWPDFEYQRILWHEVPRQAWPAVDFLLENTALLLGGSWWVAAAVGGAVVGLAVRAGRRKGAAAGRCDGPPRGIFGRPWLAVVLVAAAHVVMFDLMIGRHPAVYYWLDHRYWYYPLPFLAVLLFGVVVMLDSLLPRLEPWEKRLVQGLLVAIVAGNLASLPRLQQTMIAGPWFGPVQGQSMRLKEYLRTGTPQPELQGNYREFAARAGRSSHPASH